MSTKKTIFYNEAEGNHKLEIHIYSDMHIPDNCVNVEFSCTTCNDSYKLLITKHLAEQLVDKFKKHPMGV